MKAEQSLSLEHTHLKRQRRRPGENRERLIRAGIMEFALFGYRGASTTSIASAADVPQPHVYANFRTKQELFVCCVSRAVQRLLEDGKVSSFEVDLARDSERLNSASALTAESTVESSSMSCARTSRLSLVSLIYQAIAALGDVSLRGEILPIVTHLKASDAELFSRCIEQGASALLSLTTTKPMML